MIARRIAVLTVCALLALAGVPGCTSGPKPDGAVSAYLRDWAAGYVAAAAARTDNPTAASAALAAARQSLGAASLRTTAGRITTTGDKGTANFRATWTIRGLARPWTYEGQLTLAKPHDTWLVHWDSRDVHPGLAPGRRLSVSRVLPPRADLLDRTGNPLFTRTDVVTVGIEPRAVKNLPTLAASLAAALHIVAQPILADVGKAKPTDFVPVVTLRAADYARVKAAIHDLPGTVFRNGQQVLPPSPRFAQPLLGRVGDASKEVLADAGPGFRAGDQLGTSGLQRALNRELAGTPTARISAVATGQPAVALATIAGSPGRVVRLTVDRTVQQAADAALAGVGLPAAVVALRASTGEILAVANSAAVPFDIALAGRYPAGSTFKIVTASAALAAGLVQPAGVVDCPGTVTLGGRTIPNEDRFALGRVSLQTAFAHSCNTTFAALGVRTDPRAFRQMAAAYGIGAGWRLPVAAFSGSVPPPADEVERAFDAIGQGRVLVSPLAEALMAATVARGSVPAPSLLAGPPPQATAASPALPPVVVATLRRLTRAVVTEGTATLLARVPGGPVAGKTGTAEYGTTGPPSAHSWFTGYQGDLAFAVFVYGGQTAAVPANPVARDFLSRLAGSPRTGG